MVIAAISGITSLSYFVFDEASGKDIEIIQTERAQKITTQNESDNLDSEKINLLVQNVKENTHNESEKMFSSLEQILLTYDAIDPSTLALIIKKIDFSNQIEQSTLENLLSELKPNQKISSNVLIKSINGLIYNDSMFNGSELDLKAITDTLFSKYEKITDEDLPNEEQFDVVHQIISL